MRHFRVPGHPFWAWSHDRARPFGVIALCLLLAGCFTSTGPKFPLSGAVAALGEGGHYVAYERQDDGSYKREEPFEVKHRADGAYDFIDSKGKVLTLSLHRLRRDLYVAQASEDKGSINYVVLEVRGNEVLAYSPQCDKQDAAKLKTLGVEIRQYECVIDKVTDPMALFAAIDLGEPGSKMIRE